MVLGVGYQHPTSTPTYCTDGDEQTGQPGERYSTVYRFNFGDYRPGGSRGSGGGPGGPDDPHDNGGGGGGGGSGGNPRRPKHSNLPDFLIPAQLITYETTLDITIRKIRNASPPPPPVFAKKLLVHTESLERKTRAFLTGTFDVSADTALRTARQKIRSLKSTILSADDDVRHAEDTIHKAQAGDFLNIFNPRLGAEKPLYEFVAVGGECAEQQTTTLAQKQDIQSVASAEHQVQEDSKMSEYSSSKYSSRSSRKSTRQVEGRNE